MALQTATFPRTSFAIDRDVVGKAGAVTAGTVFLVAGMSFIGLGTAIPMVLGVVAGADGPPPVDIAVAVRVEPFWWAFALLGIVNLVAAFAAPAGRRMTDGFAIVVAGVTAMLAMVAALSLNGPAALAMSVLAGIYLAAALGTMAVPRRAS
jgi:hypothetical protein